VGRHVYPRNVVSVSWHYNIQLSVLYKADLIIISLNLTCSRHDTAEDCLVLAFPKNQLQLTFV